ncbi:hypothetical protein [Aurantiacibacter marinus]|uniref:Uncharacterized protein n=1 Tax=Aurantiacibacter marinus TaxID=874156 RepID=A0A0H0XRD8_9SPHN|nr:hypothetical protein [Aurantiacibacter marinus]KLI64899.1 hypothetical protein AAV99_05190 [Aurantiacibacter marinus]
MAKALSHRSHGQEPAVAQSETGIDWRRKVSDHVAFGLLVYTGLHIFLTMQELKTGHGSVLPYFALIVLVAAIIPACRWLEMRWERLTDSEATDPDLAPVFRKEMILLWCAAIGLPVALTFGFQGIAALF